MGLHDPANGRLRGPGLVLAKAVWGATSGLAVVLFVASLASFFAWLHISTTSYDGAPQLTLEDLHTLQRWGLSLDVYAWVDLSIYLLILLVYVGVGNVIFWRRSDDRMALLASFSLMTFPLAFATPLVGTLPPACGDRRNARQLQPRPFLLHLPQWTLCAPLGEPAPGSMGFLLVYLDLLPPLTAR